MNTTGTILILLSIMGVIAFLLYKSIIKKSLRYIGPKSIAVLIICGLLMITGIWFLLGR